MTQEGGRRCSAARAYLQPALGRKNLVVETGARATEILFDGRRATGVAYVRNGRREVAYAEREIVLCLGAIHSPQLLMLSGIGPADHLRETGIECRHDLAGVGANLHDHPQSPAIVECKRTVTLDTAETAWNFVKYAVFGAGPLTSNIAEAGVFLRTDAALDRPDIQLHFAPAYFYRHGLTGEKRVACSCAAALVQPKSRGTLRLKSNDPFAAPLLDPNYLESERDVRALMSGTRASRTIFAQAAFNDYNGGEIVPARGVESDAELERYVRESVETLYHPVGTCKMGLGPMSVVDQQLRVHGVDGLRVADASVMPKIVGGNPNAPTIMIGERAADFILSGDADPMREAESMHARVV